MVWECLTILCGLCLKGYAGVTFTELNLTRISSNEDMLFLQKARFNKFWGSQDTIRNSPTIKTIAKIKEIVLYDVESLCNFYELFCSMLKVCSLFEIF